MRSVCPWRVCMRACVSVLVCARVLQRDAGSIPTRLLQKHMKGTIQMLLLFFCKMCRSNRTTASTLPAKEPLPPKYQRTCAVHTALDLNHMRRQHAACGQPAESPQQPRPRWGAGNGEAFFHPPTRDSGRRRIRVGHTPHVQKL